MTRLQITQRLLEIKAEMITAANNDDGDRCACLTVEQGELESTLFYQDFEMDSETY